MRKLSLLFILISVCGFASAFATEGQNPSPDAGQSQLSGEWRLSGMIHQGQAIPLPNPDLYLSWTFFKNGTERLYWDRGGSEFCERFAHFSLLGDTLIEKTFAVNPNNAAECAKDPDMQLEKQTSTKVQIFEKEIRLHFQLSEEELVYILTPVPY